MSTWSIAWVRPNTETRVVNGLIDDGFESFCPMERFRRIAGRMRHSRKPMIEIVTRPAFPRYVLFAPTPFQEWGNAKSERHTRDGLTTVMRAPGQPNSPGIVPQAVLAMLRGPLGDGVIEDTTQALEAITRFAQGSGITVTSGPFAGHPGTVVGDDGRKVRVLLSILGGARPVAVDRAEIKVA